MLQLNTILKDAGVDPEGVIVARHRPFEAPLMKLFPLIIARQPDLFRVYQEFQVPRLEVAMTRARTLVSFFGHEAGKALFVAIYEIGGHRQVTHDEYWAVPGNRALESYGMSGLRDEMRTPLHFDLKETEHLQDWRGRLVVEWPGSERSWWRWATRNVIGVHAITEENQFNSKIPKWDELVLSWSQLSLMPNSWRDILSQWRGVYYIFDVKRQQGYVGSASGEENIFGRWENYRATGHGGNVQLRKSDPQDLRFSILELTSPVTSVDEVLRLERCWKIRLHSRDHGLNEN